MRAVSLALDILITEPALLVAGWYMGSKASKNLNDAHSKVIFTLKAF